MIIKWVRLKNIRSYVSEEINFPMGSIVLSGDIGSGKSTVLLAVEFALFGFSNDVSGETLLRNGKTTGSVELCIEIDGKEITIKRNLKKGKDSFSQASGYIIENNLKTEKSAEELKAFSLELLGYPSEYLKKKNMPIYRYTVYTPQEEMKKILFESREERLSALRKIFGIEKYGIIRANSEIVASSLREKVRELSSRTEDLPAKKTELEELKKEIKGTDEKIRNLKPELLALSEKKALLSKKIEALDEKREKAAHLKSMLSTYESAIKEKAELAAERKKSIDLISKRVSELQKKSSEIPILEETDESKIESEFEKISKELSAKERGYSEANEKERMLLLRKKEIEKEISEEKELEKAILLREKEIKELSAGKKREELEKERDAKEKLLREIIEKKSRASLSKEESEKLISEISLHKICPLCKQEITDNYKEHISAEEKKKESLNRTLIESLAEEEKEKESEIKILREESKKAADSEARTNRLSAEVSALKKSASEIEKKKELIEKVSKEISEIKKEEDEKEIILLREKTEDMKKRLKCARERNAKAAEKKAILAQLERENELLSSIEKESSEIKKSVSELNRKKLESEDELGKLGKTDEEFQKAKTELEYAAKKEKDTAVLSGALESENSMKQKNAEKLDSEIKDKSKDKKKFELYKDIEEMISEKFTVLVSQMEKQVMSSLHYEFGKLFQEWFGALIEEETMSARIDEDFTPVITEDGHDTAVENLSGGEKTAVALAYRLALNRVINDMVSTIKTKDLIILDEPTDGFSTEQLDKVRLVLDELNLAQTIIVSHEAKIESFVEHVIRITKQEHESRVLV
jgi:exonuclease SbcC